jgi:hypothetical protein
MTEATARRPGADLRSDVALRLAAIVASNLTRGYPYHDSHLFRPGDGPVHPATSHPAFSNSFDWHSSVHSHWTAVRLLDYFAGWHPRRAGVKRLTAAVARNLTAQRLAAEHSYLRVHPSYERPYGWAWAMMLAAAVRQSTFAPVRPARASLRRIAVWIAAAALRWLRTLPGPVRHGTHANTAFTCGLMWDAAGVLGFSDLRRAIRRYARVWFAGDAGYPQEWERSAHDFLSPGLAEADLMRRVLMPAHFRLWWRRFVPGSQPHRIMVTPIDVPSGSDGQIAHLHGLNVSRAGMLARLAVAFGRHGSRAEHRLSLKWLAAARRLYDASVEHALGRDYNLTHWLGTFTWDAASSIDEAVRLLGAGDV